MTSRWNGRQQNAHHQAPYIPLPLVFAEDCSADKEMVSKFSGEYNINYDSCISALIYLSILP
jgi:hypothetical protein